MKLVRLRFEQYFRNPWGFKSYGDGTYRVIDMLEVWLNEEVRYLQRSSDPIIMECPVWESNDGRTWLEIPDTVAWFTMAWYKPLFKEPRDPALSKYEVGPPTKWVTYEEATKTKLVNSDLRPVDIEGNVL